MGIRFEHDRRKPETPRQMIVREAKSGFRLISQHDHALVSGEFARRVSGDWLGEAPLREDVLFAVSNHDVGWKRLDSEVLWNEERGRPYSFVDYPAGEKMAAYSEGLDLVEAHSPYAALLCSTHYGSFVKRSEVPAEVRFREREEVRRERIEASMDVPETFGRDFRLLQLCDGLSLFVCLNDARGGVHPWHENGFEFSGRKFHPVWKDEHSLGFDPNLLSEGFEVSLPYRVAAAGDGSVVERNTSRLRVTL
ncbi:MAG: DUF3891 family protein [Rubrobacteraceae bacterium]|nr:DUF3891 family protein [Rubrobacter sp.]